MTRTVLTASALSGADIGQILQITPALSLPGRRDETVLVAGELTHIRHDGAYTYVTLKGVIPGYPLDNPRTSQAGPGGGEFVLTPTVQVIVGALDDTDGAE